MQITFLMFLSLMLLILGIVILISKINLDKLGVKGEGEIVDVVMDKEEMLDPLNNRIILTVYKPIVKFFTEDGEEKRIVLDMAKKEEEIKIGSKINILYPSNKPSEVMVNSRLALYRLPIVFISLGVMFMIFAIVIAII